MVLPSFRPFVLLPVCPSFHLSRRFLGIVSLVFSKFWNGARNLYEVVRDRAELSGRIFLPPKLGKWTKNGPKTGSFKFIEKSGHYFLLNLSYNKNLFYLLHFWTIAIFGKIFVPEIWAKRSQQIRLQDFLINHISRTDH